MTLTKRFHGAVVPMVTPFTPDGALDEPAVRRLLDHLQAGGVTGVLLLGTTGEDASICPSDRLRLVQTATDHTAGRLTIYAGIAANCLAQSVEAAEAYHAAGADALVARLPTYYALSPQEQHNYYQQLLAQVPGPVFLYNIPITTHMSLPLEVVEALSRHPKVAGIKDSENDLAHFQALLERLGGRDDFSIFCGTGAYFGRALAEGADGFVPTAGNLVPDLCQRLYAQTRAGQLEAASECDRQLREVAGLYGGGRLLGQTYGVIKAMLGVWRVCNAHVLPPLTTPAPEDRAAFQQQFKDWLQANPAAGRPAPSP